MEKKVYLEKYMINRLPKHKLKFLIIFGNKRYMAAFFRQVKIGVLTLTLEKKQ